MAFFRKKGKYWYFVETCLGVETQHYLGSQWRIFRMINFANKHKKEWGRGYKKAKTA